MMVHIREDCIATSFSLAARHRLSDKRPMMEFMGITEHGNICLPTIGLGGLCVTFGWGPMSIFAVFFYVHVCFLRGWCISGQPWES